MANKLPYLNVGCGSHFHKDWTNVDFVSTGEGVLAYNLLQGIPFADESFEVVYHSHVLEHFLREDGINFLQECNRILKPGGTIRIAIPDLEKITRNYLHFLEVLQTNSGDEYQQACYDWMMLEMYDQTVRNTSGGNMLDYLAQKRMINQDFVIERCGYEVSSIIKYLQNNSPDVASIKNKSSLKQKVKSLPSLLKRKSIKYLLGEDGVKALEIGRFRIGGEVHCWMYDNFSLGRLLKQTGFHNIKKVTASESDIPGWNNYGLELINGEVRKPDSLFMEARK
ncbi:MAG: class I SAM-dependent methyltransferase [Chitinophagaceae bacterium]